MRKNKNFSKYPFIVCTTVACLHTLPLHAEKTSSVPQSTMDQEEAFLVRRIAEFWKDQDYKLVKEQILSFLSTHPQSKLADQLRGMYGDIMLQEGSYAAAIEYYDQIKQSDVVEKTIINKLQCYYELNDFQKIVKQGEPFLFSQKGPVVERKSELQFLMADSLLRLSMEEAQPAVKKKQASQAKTLFEGLKSSSFGDHSQLALAEIYVILDEHQLAGEQYTQLAKTHVNRREEFLFHAGLAFAKSNPQHAITTFNEVISLKGKHLNDASYNHLVLLFDQNHFAEVVKADSQFAMHMSDDKKPSYEYMMGRSFFALEQYETAQTHLNKYVAISQSGTPQHKNATLMLLSCADKLHQKENFDKALSVLSSNYPQANELSQALLIQGLMTKSSGNVKEAEQQLKHILQTYPKFEDRETLLLEYGLVTHDAQDYKTSYTTLKQYLTTFPEGKEKAIAYKYLLSSSFHLHQSGAQNYSKADFFADVNQVLAAQAKLGTVFNAEEERDCKFIQCKTAYELEKNDVALKLLSQYIDTYQNHVSLGEAHFLVALCHQKLGADPVKFYENTEKALEIDPKLKDSSNIHLQLYNSYLSKATELSSKNKENPQPYFDKAAEHLYIVFQKNDSPIKLQNKLWLAGQFYQKYTKGEDTDGSFSKAIAIYESSLINPASGKVIELSKETAFAEPEIMKYVDLLSNRGDSAKAISTLRDLVSQQYAQSQVDWQLKKQSLLELAKAYELNNKDQEALETFSFITSQFNTNSSYIVDYAKLHKARLEVKLGNTHGSSEQVSDVLSTFKEIQIKKQVESEPLHLEAALDYAKFRGKIAANDEKESRYMFFLGRIKEDFESTQDAMSQEYQKNLAANPDKKNLYDMYMLYVEGEILRMKARIELQSHRVSAAEELNSQALSKFAEIQNQGNLTPYLKQQIEASIKEIDTSNSY